MTAEIPSANVTKVIFVDRGTVTPPAALASRAATEEYENASEFYRQDAAERRQKRFRWEVYREPEVRQALVHLFHGKCAYCETPVSEPSDASHHRPIAGVVRSDGSLLPDHYWWLALEWSNLYLICTDCNRSRSAGTLGPVTKSIRFPLRDEGRRAPLEGSPAHIAEESPLLLDPCAQEPAYRPEKHLVFLEDGRVVSDSQRGQATIELLQLNRDDLRAARAEAWVRASTLVNRVLEHSAKTSQEFAAQLAQVQSLTDAGNPHAAVARQLVASSERQLKQLQDPRAASLADEVGLTDSVSVDAQRVRKAVTSHDQYARRQEQFSLTDASTDAVYRSVTRRIERVVLHNIKAIQHAALHLSPATASSTSATSAAPWTVLLGENATGKSTILQALAIALIGQQEVERLGLVASDFIRKAPRVTRGTIDVYLTGSRASRRVVVTEDGFQFVRSAEPQTLVLGYGELRLFPTPGLRRASGSRASRVEPLFRPARSLTDADKWLLSKHTNDETFDYVGRSLKDLLGLDEQRQWLDRSTGRVCVLEDSGPMSLRELSTGWQSVIATVVDIMELTLKLWPTPETAEGLVLLDELGAHLHPTWRMRVVSGLRRMLPSMQFVATTHEPLCLRGLEDKEVVLMARDDRNRAFATTDLPSPRGLRVDQLLTSRYFGLSTTLDPELEEDFARYYELLSYPDHQLDHDQRAERDRLATELQHEGVLGYTRRDQLVYEAIDEFLAQERAAARSPNATPPSHAATIEKVTRLWALANQAEAAGERP